VWLRAFSSRIAHLAPPGGMAPIGARDGGVPVCEGVAIHVAVLKDGFSRVSRIALDRERA
jgi:hypothetical protein